MARERIARFATLKLVYPNSSAIARSRLRVD